MSARANAFRNELEEKCPPTVLSAVRRAVTRTIYHAVRLFEEAEREHARDHHAAWPDCPRCVRNVNQDMAGALENERLCVEIARIKAEHEERVTGLLAANTAEVNRRREAEADLATARRYNDRLNETHFDMERQLQNRAAGERQATKERDEARAEVEEAVELGNECYEKARAVTEDCAALRAEVERLTGELADWKRNGHIYLAEIIRKNEERLSLAEKLAEGVLFEARMAGFTTSPMPQHLSAALDAFISSGSEPQAACPRCGTGAPRHPKDADLPYDCPSCGHVWRDAWNPPAQPSKDPGDVPMESSLEMAEEIARLKVGYEAERYAAKQWMDDCRKAEARLTSLEEENAKLRAFRDAAARTNGGELFLGDAGLRDRPALVEEEREMAAQAPPANAKGCGEIIGYSGLLPVRCGPHALCAVCREPQATPRDHAAALADAVREDDAGRPVADLLRQAADYLLRLGGGPMELCLRGTANAIESALADYEREASEPRR